MSDETPEGCQHREHPTASKCNKVCDAGQIICPYHLLLAQAANDPIQMTEPPTREQRKRYTTPRGYTE